MNFKDFEALIFHNQYGYSLTVGHKKKNSEEYDNAFIDVYFKKGVSLDDRTKIHVKDSWLSFMRNEKTNKTYFYIFINDFEDLGKISKKEDVIDSEKKEVDKIIEQMDSNNEEQVSINEFLK